MMVGILVHNYPEDYIEAIEFRDIVKVQELLDEDMKNLRKAVIRSREEYSQVHAQYNALKKQQF